MDSDCLLISGNRYKYRSFGPHRSCGSGEREFMTNNRELERHEVEYQTPQGLVKLNAAIVRKWCPEATETDCFEFVQFCRYLGLNPYLNEVYIIKYGTDAAQFQIDYHVFMRKAAQMPGYLGYTSGVFVWRDDKMHVLQDAFSLPTDVLLGAWCEVHLQGFELPVRVALPISELQQRKRNGDLTRIWSSRPNMMAEKTVIAAAHRRADRSGGLESMFLEGEHRDDSGDTLEATPVGDPGETQGEFSTE